MLNQLAEGLNTLQVLTYIRAYPHTLEPLFVPAMLLEPCDIKKILVKPTGLNYGREVLWITLQQFIDDCKHDGKSDGKYIVLANTKFNSTRTQRFPGIL